MSKPEEYSNLKCIWDNAHNDFTKEWSYERPESYFATIIGPIVGGGGGVGAGTEKQIS